MEMRICKSVLQDNISSGQGEGAGRLVYARTVYGMVVRDGMVRYGTIRYGTERDGMVRYDMSVV